MTPNSIPRARLAAYGTDRHTLEAVGRALFGELAPAGNARWR